jgi:transcription initiation factor IIF auxiliary subunit
MKWLGWLGRLIITIVVVCLLTVVTTGYVVNYYIEHMLSRYHISMTDGGPSVTDIMKGLVGMQSSTTSPTDEESISNGKDQEQGKDLNKNKNQDNMNLPNLPPATGGANAGNGDASGNGSGDGNEKSTQKENVVVTPDDLIAKKEGIESKDKEAIFTILMSKLPQEEMQKLSEYMEGGLTETEVLAIEQMLSKYLDKTEYAKVMEVLKK